MPRPWTFNVVTPECDLMLGHTPNDTNPYSRCIWCGARRAEGYEGGDWYRVFHERDTSINEAFFAIPPRVLLWRGKRYHFEREYEHQLYYTRGNANGLSAGTISVRENARPR